MNNHPNDWVYGSLGDIAKVVSGYAFASSDFHDNEQEGMPVIRMSDIQENGLNLSTAKRVSNFTQSIEDKFGIRNGDLLFGMSGSIEKSILVNHSCEALLNQRVGALRPRQENGNFHAFVFQSDIVKNQILDLAAGGAQLNISAKQVESIQIPIPSLPEQKKIAEILSGIEDSISTEWQIIRVLLGIRRASLKNLTFGKGAQAQRIDSGTEFGLIPSHWTCEQIPNCCLIENSKRKPIKKEDRSQMRGNYPYHGATRIQDYISEFAYEGEYVLIGEDGDHFSKFDDWEMAQFASGRFNVSNHAHVIKGGDRCRAKWLFYSLLHRDLTLHLTRQGATRFKLSKATLECIPILIPPLAEQDKMINLFDSISSLIELRSKKVEKLNAAKAAIANDLLTGRKRVSV